MIDLERLWAGDPEYLEELVRSRGPMVLMVARSYGKDPYTAEDLFQEIWAHAIRKRRSYDGRGSFDGWLHRLARNVCVQEYRRVQARHRLMDRVAREEDVGWHAVDPLSGTVQRNTHLQLHRAMGELSEREHEAVTLRIIEGRPPDEVAAIMGVEKASVRSHIRHAVRRLRDIMGEQIDGLSND